VRDFLRIGLDISFSRIKVSAFMSLPRIAGVFLLSLSMTVYSSGCVEESTDSEMECCRTNLCPMHGSRGTRQSHDCCSKLAASQQAPVAAISAPLHLAPPASHAPGFAAVATAVSGPAAVVSIEFNVDRPPPLALAVASAHPPLRV
jgi:hypothetical protein